MCGSVAALCLVLDSGLSTTSLSPSWVIALSFVGHSASLHLGVQMCFSKFNASGGGGLPVIN